MKRALVIANMLFISAAVLGMDTSNRKESNRAQRMIRERRISVLDAGNKESFSSRKKKYQEMSADLLLKIEESKKRGDIIYVGSEGNNDQQESVSYNQKSEGVERILQVLFEQETGSKADFWSSIRTIADEEIAKLKNS